MGTLTLVLLAAALGARPALAETVVLQQGAGGYAGCSARVLGPGPAAPAGTVLPVRGSRNRFAVRFEMPAGPAGRKLARARLGLFLPEARQPNVFTEILCREIVAAGEGPAVDEKTDYDSGPRRP